MLKEKVKDNCPLFNAKEAWVRRLTQLPVAVLRQVKEAAAPGALVPAAPRDQS